jgi:murein DD-endopeptidase MepM/ murein hydrolase activator NlpD
MSEFCRPIALPRRAVLRMLPGLCGWLILARPVRAAEDGQLALPGNEPHAPSASLPPPTGVLPDDISYVAETGHYVRGAFLDYWRENGGPARFGYPLSEEFVARGTDGLRRTVQIFDNARLELHREADGTARVELGQLGREDLGGQVFPGGAPFVAAPDRVYFAETGHVLIGDFLAFWRANGGLAFLGYPLSERLTSGDHAMQYFERGILEATSDGPVRPVALGADFVSGLGWPLPARLALGLSPSAPGQGTTTIADLFADRPFEVAGARYDDRPVTFFGVGNYYRAFIGIAPDQRVGAHRLTVDVRDSGPAGGPKTLALDLAVRETAFPRERIVLPPDQDDLLDPAVGERELAIVTPLYAIFTPQALWSAPFKMPAQGPITTEFGEIRAYNDGPFNSWHNGLDIGADEGAPIIAPAPGRVVYTGRLDIRGNFTALDHGLGILTCYFHQSQILVQVGQSVQTGDLIGRVGTTGLSTGAHLHWEVRVEGIPVSPWQWVQGAGVR